MTPGIVLSSVETLRPLIGNSSMRVRSSVLPRLGLSVVTIGVASSTCTVMWVLAGTRITSTTVDCCTLTVMAASNLFMPGDSTVNL